MKIDSMKMRMALPREEFTQLMFWHYVVLVKRRLEILINKKSKMNCAFLYTEKQSGLFAGIMELF